MGTCTRLFFSEALRIDRALACGPRHTTGENEVLTVCGRRRSPGNTPARPRTKSAGTGVRTDTSRQSLGDRTSRGCTLGDDWEQSNMTSVRPAVGCTRWQLIGAAVTDGLPAKTPPKRACHHSVLPAAPPPAGRRPSQRARSERQRSRTHICSSVRFMWNRLSGLRSRVHCARHAPPVHPRRGEAERRRLHRFRKGAERRLAFDELACAKVELCRRERSGGV